MTWRVLGVGLAVATLGCTKPQVRPSAPRTSTVIRISAFQFLPAEVVVSVRDTVVWVNDDDFAHTTTSDYATWASPELSKGGRYTLIAPAPGRYLYHCAAHPGMKAVLEVRVRE